MVSCMKKPEFNQQQTSTGVEMSLAVESCPRLRWTLKIPKYQSHSRVVSPTFKYRNVKGSLLCVCDDELISLYFRNAIMFDESFKKPCSVTVDVKNCVTGAILPSLTDHDSVPSKDYLESIWEKDISKIEEVYPGFRQHFELTFIVTITAKASETSTDEKSVQTSLCIDPIPCSESLSEDLEKLLQLDSDSNPDVEFQSDGHCIKAHRLVVSARSPVLAKMLQSQMVEGTTGIIKIEDMDLDSLKHFVRYLYTGRLEEAPTSEAALALYEAADKYEVKSLFRRCAQYLFENLNVENACNVLAVADAHSDEELVEKVTVFVLENKMPNSDDGRWSTFCDSHSKLANKVYHHFYKMIIK